MQYLYDGYGRNPQVGVGADLQISEVAGGQQRLTQAAALAIYALLSNKFASVSGSMYKPAFVLTPGQDPAADAQAFLFYVATTPPADAVQLDLSTVQGVALVDLAAANKNIAGTPADLAVVVAKDAATAQALSQPGASLAVLPPQSQAVSGATAAKKDATVKTLLWGAAGAVAGAVVGGPVGAVVGGVGAAILAHELAA